MGTPLQDVYDRFFSKVDENLTGKESLVYNILISAISRSKKVVNHSLIFVLDETLEGEEPLEGEEETYKGEFTDTLDDDEIEFISLRMLYEKNRRRLQYLISLQQLIGTKDFSNLPDKVKELNAIQLSQKDLQEEIDSFKNEFNTYTYS